MTADKAILDHCLRVLRMAPRNRLEVVLGALMAQLCRENRLNGLSGVISEMGNAINHYDLHSKPPSRAK